MKAVPEKKIPIRKTSNTNNIAGNKSWKKCGGAISPPLVIAADAPATNKTFRMSAPITLPIAKSKPFSENGKVIL